SSHSSSPKQSGLEARLSVNPKSGRLLNMPKQYHRQLAFYVAVCLFPIVIFFASLATGRTSASGVRPRTTPAALQAQLRELDDQLRDPRFLLLRSGAFDPLSSEPPALRIGAGQLE